MGKEDSVVLKLLIDRACASTGLHFTEAINPDAPKAGEYVHLASREAHAPASVIKVLGTTAEDIRKLQAVLHGQAIQVGPDLVGIEVKNDVMLTTQGLGNGARARN